MNVFGKKIKELRESRNLLQRQVASKLEIDTPMLSKIEHGDRFAKKEQVIQLALLYQAETNILLTLWLADRIHHIIKDEEVAAEALMTAANELHEKTKN